MSSASNISRIKQIINMQRFADTSTVTCVAHPYDCTTANVLWSFESAAHKSVSYDCSSFKRRFFLFQISLVSLRNAWNACEDKALFISPVSHLSLPSSCDGAHSLPSVVYEMSYKEHSADSETSVLYTFTYCMFKHAIVSCWRGTFDPWSQCP